MTESRKITERKDGCLVVEYRFTADGYNEWEMHDCRFSADCVDVPEVGRTYLVGQSDYVGPNSGMSNLLWSEDYSEGWPGNSDGTIKRYHGWRGTTNDRAFYGMGVRKCLDVKSTGSFSKKVRIVFGKDICIED